MYAFLNQHLRKMEKYFFKIIMLMFVSNEILLINSYKCMDDTDSASCKCVNNACECTSGSSSTRNGLICDIDKHV